jgi:hypothetical protein
VSGRHRRTGSGLHLVQSGEGRHEAAGGEPADQTGADAGVADSVEELLLAQRGYQAAADAADSATVPSLNDFVD